MGHSFSNQKIGHFKVLKRFKKINKFKLTVKNS